ncbi:hypothetical protein FRX31_035248 [Thalictrum thalictroides]|uniref:Uncharacterized protein n=1 Tax=Thalictrum thalictroides TaxID=46969 RepID=A0A7J6USB9_THATH|nr:hypothetical protein FRX31_035248 [Thalictrum thalictroides]
MVVEFSPRTKRGVEKQMGGRTFFCLLLYGVFKIFRSVCLDEGESNEMRLMRTMGCGCGAATGLNEMR